MSRRFALAPELGRLAFWLRVMGYDTLYLPDAGFDRLVTLAARDGRILLTRSATLARRHHAHLLKKVKAAQQLQEIRDLLSCNRNEWFTRCTRCNRRLQAAGHCPPEAPPGADVKYCPACGHYYWEGSHTAKMAAHLNNLFTLPEE